MANNNTTSRYFGGWFINISTNKELLEKELAPFFRRVVFNECTPLAYLGKQSLGAGVSFGINHAILAEQHNYSDNTTRIVLAIFYTEKDLENSKIISIERILESYSNSCKKYDIQLNPNVEIPVKAQNDFDSVKKPFDNLIIEPFVYLGGQECVKGVNYFFAAEITSLDTNKKNVALLTINAEENSFEIISILF